MRKHLKENVFPFDFSSVVDQDREQMDRHLRGHKTLNNLGYLIVEFSRVDEAKGCLLHLNLQQPHLLANLASLSPHLTADPFYFYNKFKRVNYLIDKHTSLQLDQQPEQQSHETITIEDVFKKEMLEYLGGGLSTPSDQKVVEAYLEEKQFNDSNQFSNQLHQYLNQED